MTKPTSPLIASLHDPEAETELFRDMMLTELRAAWSRAHYAKRLARGIPADEMHETMLSVVYEFAAETGLLEDGVSREDFLEDMGNAYDVAMSDIEVEPDDEEEEESEAILTPPPVRSVQELLADVAKDAPKEV